MTENELLQRVIERFWDTVPPVWRRVRGSARAIATHDFDITLAQFYILRHILHGAHSVGELAERLLISRPAISQAIDLLVEKGMVSRTQDVRDRRFVQIDLTESGNSLLNEVFRKNRQWMAGQLAGLSSDELEAVDYALGILKNTFDCQKE